MSNQYTVTLTNNQFALVLAGLGALRTFAEAVPGTDEQRQARHTEIREVAATISKAKEVVQKELTNREATILSLAIATLGELFAMGQVEDDIALNITNKDIQDLDAKLLLTKKYDAWMAGNR